MQFFKATIKYLGHIIDEKGRKPDLARVTAIKNMPPPTNVSILRPRVGVVNYSSNLIPKIGALSALLKQLLKIMNGTGILYVKTHSKKL